MPRLFVSNMIYALNDDVVSLIIVTKVQVYFNTGHWPCRLQPLPYIGLILTTTECINIDANQLVTGILLTENED